MRFMIIAAGLVAGCSGAVPQASPQSCNAVAYMGLIGQDAASALAVPEPKRLYVVGEPVTSDFVPERINIELDTTDTIVAVKCG